MQKKLIRVIILIIVAIFAVAGYFGFRIIKSTVTETPESPFNIPHKGGNGPAACTQEAKQCPDGSYVSRSGPNCEFAACPNSNSNQGTEIDEQIYCQSDSDCACGVKIGTRECFVGNKDFVNPLGQCPDFCTGIDGKLTTKCVNNYCILAR
jgi:hypothetical protein